MKARTFARSPHPVLDRNSLKNNASSGMDITLELVGSKWKILILWNLRNGAKRFTDIRKHIPTITEKMLSLQLKQLEADHFLSREVFAEVPPRVEYSLTDEGKTLLPMLEAMSAWGEQRTKTIV